MNNQMQAFHSKEFGSLEILMSEGKLYFPATECAAILGYRDPHKAVKQHTTADGWVNRPVIDTLGRTQEKKYISEGNLYRLIARSKLPAAERFERWIFDEVLPCIRKYGAYATSDTLDELLRNPAFAGELIRQLSDEREKSAALEELAVELAPKALYCDLILQSKSVVPVSLIAKDYGLSATSFNRFLHRIGIQYKVGGTWLLYQKYAGRGYTQTRTYHVGERTTAMHTCWTQKGRLFLYERLKGYGLLPLIEKRAI